MEAAENSTLSIFAAVPNAETMDTHPGPRNNWAGNVFDTLADEISRSGGAGVYLKRCFAGRR